MNAEKFAASLIEDAQKKAAAVAKEAKQESDSFKKETAAMVRNKAKTLEAAVKKKEQEERLRLEAKRQRDANLATLECKKQLVNTAFEAAEKSIAAMAAKKREQILEKLWESTQGQIDVGSCVVAKKDAAFFKGKTTVSEAEGLGGFIAKSKDGTVLLDMRFEKVLRQVEEQHVGNVATILLNERKRA